MYRDKGTGIVEKQRNTVLVLDVGTFDTKQHNITGDERSLELGSTGS